jgi:GT2 family glycosyltransferase
MAEERIISVIYVNFNTHKLIEESIESLSDQPYQNFQIAIVDNSPGKQEFRHLEKIQKKFPNILITLFKPKYNLGFAAGNNYAIRRLHSKYYFLFNGDTLFEKKCSLETFVNYMDTHLNVGMVAPKILYYSKKNLIWYAGALIDPRSTYFVRHIGENEIDKGQYDKIKETGYAVGTALFVRKEVIEKCGLLDEILFLYAEETEWNVRAQANGFKSVYLPDVTIYHKVTEPSQQTRWKMQSSYFQSYLFLRNITILAFQHYPWYTGLYYLSHYAIKKLATQLFLSIKKRDLKLFFIQLRALSMGIIVGLFRKLKKSLSKLIVIEYHYINHFTKDSRSVMNSQKPTHK